MIDEIRFTVVRAGGWKAREDAESAAVRSAMLWQ